MSDPTPAAPAATPAPASATPAPATPTPAPASAAPAPATPTPAKATPAPATPTPATPAKAAKAAKPGKLGGKAAEPATTEALREHASTIALVLVVLVALGLVVLFQVRKDREFDRQAWTRLAELRDRSDSGAEGFAELAQEFRGSAADPFIRITWAARLYELGTKGDVQRAKELLEQVIQENQGNAFLRERVTPQLERLQAELSDPRAKLIDLPAPSAPTDQPEDEEGEGAFPPVDDEPGEPGEPGESDGH